MLGAVCPQNGQCAAVIFNHCDSEVCQVFLDHLTQRVPRDPTKRRYLIVDNASWHKVKRLNWHHFNPKQLPPYPPDLNPIERRRLGFKPGFFADFIAKTNEDLITQLITGLRHFLTSPTTTARLGSLKASLGHLFANYSKSLSRDPEATALDSENTALAAPGQREQCS